MGWKVCAVLVSLVVAVCATHSHALRTQMGHSNMKTTDTAKVVSKVGKFNLQLRRTQSRTTSTKKTEKSKSKSKSALKSKSKLKLKSKSKSNLKSKSKLKTRTRVHNRNNNNNQKSRKTRTKRSKKSSSRSKHRHHSKNSKNSKNSNNGSFDLGIPSDCSNALPTMDQWRYTKNRLSKGDNDQDDDSDLESLLSRSQNTVLVNQQKNRQITTLLHNVSKSHHLPKVKTNKLLATLSNYSGNRPPDVVALERCVMQYQEKKEEVVTKIDNDLFDSGFVKFLQTNRVQEREQNFWPDNPAWTRALMYDHDAVKLHLKFSQADNFIVYPRIFDFDNNSNTIVVEVVEGMPEDGEMLTYLPWAVDYVTHMQMFDNSTIFMTGPLDGCNVYVARKAGQLPVVMHANANHHNPGFLFNTRYKFCRALEVLKNDWPGYVFTHALQRQDYCRHPAKCGYTFVWGSKNSRGEWQFYRHFAQTGGTFDTNEPSTDIIDSHLPAKNWALQPVPDPPDNCATLLSKL